MLTQERLKELLHYDPDTGIFTWKTKVCKKIKIGDIAGSPDDRGYWSIGIDKKKYGSHRLAWLYTYDEWPLCEIDHIDTIKHNNAIDNLRDVSSGVNKENKISCRKDNKSGFLGVNGYGKKYRALIMINRQLIHLGVFDTPEQAHAAYLEAKRKYHSGNTL